MPETLSLRVDSARVTAEIDALARISDTELPAVTRIVFSERDREAREWMKALYREAGLEIRQDAVGNTFAKWQGQSKELPALATGSHVDAIPHAGKYDGVVGVLGGLEAIRTLQRSGFQPARSIELIQFTSEEPTRFGIGCVGSRLLSGTLEAATADKLRDKQDHSLRELRHNAGFSGDLANVRLPRGHYVGFVELHIEQGPLLEQNEIPIGAVTHIAAPATLQIHFEGEGGHAGGRLMPGRRDAFCAAAEAVLAVEQSALSTGAIDTVATAGTCEIYPGAVNSIPSRVRIGVDVRDIDGKRRDATIQSIRDAVVEISRRRRVTSELQLINADPPSACAPQIIDAIERACNMERLACRRMVSRAYHDSLFMSRICPVAMIFIPCRNGVSHRPDEYASPEAIEAGISVLARTLADFAS